MLTAKTECEKMTINVNLKFRTDFFNAAVCDPSVSEMNIRSLYKGSFSVKASVCVLEIQRGNV